MVDINRIKVGDKVLINIRGWSGYGTPLRVTRIILDSYNDPILVRLKHLDGEQANYRAKSLDYYNNSNKETPNKTDNKLIKWLQASKST